MYIVYDKLWELLLSKKISKTDLCNLTGMSSRTMAKLSKNQSVTTDTLLSICSVLGCQLSDIAEIKEDKSAASIYEAYLTHGKKVWENDVLDLVEFEFGGMGFAVYVTKDKAVKKSVVHCSPEGGVSLERIYPCAHTPISTVNSIFHPALIKAKKTTVLLITGTPGNITGLDNGIVYSARRGCQNGRFYVMSISAFKLFCINAW